MKRTKSGRLKNSVVWLKSTANRAKAAGKMVRFKTDMPMSMGQSVYQTAQKHPEHAALLFEDKRWTYREMNREIEKRALVLSGLGLGKGDRVALMMSNRPEFLFNTLALNRLGVAVALINTSLVHAGLRHAITIAEPAAAIIGAEHLAAFVEAGDQTAWDPAMRLLVDTEGNDASPDLPDGATDLGPAVTAATHQSLPPVTVLGSDLAGYIYTSGTTGLPKAGKILNARALMASTGFGGAALGLGPWDTVYCCLPLFHSNGLLVASSSALCNGATLALARKFSASRFWDDVRRSETTIFVYIGELCRYLLSQPERPDDADHKLRAMIGNGLRPEVWSEFLRRHKPGRIHEFYGATEGNVNMINLTGKFGSVGKMPPLKKLNNALLVRFDHDAQMPARDANGRCIPCPPGEPGELLGRINTDMVSQRFDGYANEEASKKKVLRDVLNPGDAYFRSGDLLKQDDKGYYYFVDRIGDTFRWKGENVSTNEVADAITKLDSVDIANVYGVHLDGADGRAGMATIVPAEGAEFDPEAFYAHAAAELPHYAVPAFVRVAGGVSLTATFKLRKVDLVREAYDIEAVADPIYYRDDKAKTFQRLNPKAYQRLLAAEIRF